MILYKYYTTFDKCEQQRIQLYWVFPSDQSLGFYQYINTAIVHMDFNVIQSGKNIV